MAKTTYQIQPGDTLNKIAQQYGTTPEAISKQNNIPNPNMIKAGTTISFDRPVFPTPDTMPIKFQPTAVPATNIRQSVPQFNTPPAPSFSNTAIAVDSTAEKPIVTPQPVEPQPTERDNVKSYLDRLLNRDVAGEKAQLRQDAGLMAKQQEANRLQTELQTRKRAYEKQIKELEKNKEGKFGGAVEQDIADLRRKANEELADISIQAEFALNNYQGAEKILNAQIADIDTEFNNQMKTYQLAQDFLQNDLSESEKLTIQNNMRLEEEKRNNAEFRARAKFEAALKASTAGSESGAPQIYNINGVDSIWDGTKFVAANVEGGIPGSGSSKPLSGDAAKIFSITQTLVPEVEQLKKRFTEDYTGTVRKILSKTDPELNRLVDNVADKVGRIRSGGAVNTDEEKRFRAQIARTSDLFFGNVDATTNALDSIIAEANTIVSGVTAGTNAASQVTSPYVADPLNVLPVNTNDPLGIF